MTQKTSGAQWSRGSWRHVLGAVLAIILAWWPVIAVLHVAVLCRFIKGAELAGQYVLLFGVPSWILGLVVAVLRRAREPRFQFERWTVFAVCVVPLAVIAFRIPVLVARSL